MRNPKVQMLVEAGLMLALAMILSNIVMFRMPAGGSVTLGSMIPILIFSMRWGWQSGVFVGVVFGLLQMAFGGYVVSVPQAILDYPLAFGFIGLAGLGKNKVKASVMNGTFEGIKVISVWTVIAIFLRFLSHVASGLLFFSDGLSLLSPATWWISISYNGGFLLVETIIAAAILSVIGKPVMTVYLQKKM